MLDSLKNFALEFNSKDVKEYFTNRINKIAEDLASKKVLLINITEMESIFDPTKVLIEPSDSSIEKMTLDSK